MKNRMIAMEEGCSVILGERGTWTSFQGHSEADAPDGPQSAMR